MKLVVSLVLLLIPSTLSSEPLIQTGDEKLSPAESRQVDQFVRHFNKQLRRTRDLKPFLRQPITGEFVDRMLLDTNNPLSPVDQNLRDRRNIAELRAFWFALSNLAYLSELYVYTRRSMDGIRTYELPRAEQYPQAVLQLMKRDPILVSWWKESDSGDSKHVVKSIAQLRQLTRTFESAASLMRKYFRARPPEQTANYQGNLASRRKYLGVFDVSSCSPESNCVGLPLNTKTVTVNVPILTLMLAWIDGKLEILAIGGAD